MTTTFKNRIVGSAILVIAAVVFLPDLLDGQKQVRKDDFKAVPERPEFAEVATQQVFTDDQHQADREKAMTPPTEQEPASEPPVDTEFKTQEFASTTAGGPVSTDPEPTAVTTPVTPAPTNEDKKPATVAEPVVENPSKAEARDTMTAEQALIAKRAAEALKKPEESVADEIQREASAELQKVQATTTKPLTSAAWMVRVGSFSKEQNANSLVAKLKAAGFTTSTRKIINGKGETMVSVIVGPDLKKDKLERSLPQLQQLSNVSVLRVSPYQPVENN